MVNLVDTMARPGHNVENTKIVDITTDHTGIITDHTEKRAQLRAFLERSRTELADLIYGTSQKSDTPSDVEQA